MNAVIYERIRGITVSEGGCYTTYGIAARLPHDSEQDGITIAAIPDVSTDGEAVDALVARCNRSLPITPTCRTSPTRPPLPS